MVIANKWWKLSDSEDSRSLYTIILLPRNTHQIYTIYPSGPPTPWNSHSMTPHSPECLLTSMVALSWPPLFIFLSPPLSPGCVSCRRSPAPIILLSNFSPKVNFYSISIALNNNYVLMMFQFLFKFPRLFNALQIQLFKHTLDILPKDLTDTLNLTCSKVKH